MAECFYLRFANLQKCEQFPNKVIVKKMVFCFKRRRKNVLEIWMEKDR